MKQDPPWTIEVHPRTGWLQLNLREVWQFRDLLGLLVRRDIVTVYKQTILGPLWFFIQPLLTTIVFTVVFGKIAGIPTDGIPQTLFYLTGLVLWQYFADCVRLTADAFTKNEQVFSKVYFPRVIVPMSIVVSNLVKFGIQFLLVLGFVAYYWWAGSAISFQVELLLLPLLVMMAAGLGLGFGLVVSSLTFKYRDLNFLIQFGIQLAMYATPVIYPLSEAPEEYRTLILANPMSALIESFRYALVGAGSFDWWRLAYSGGFMLVLLFVGMIVFTRTEKTFVDTV